MIWLFYRAFERFFLSLIHSLFMSGIVNLTSVRKGDGKDPGKVTTAFKFCGHWRIVLLLDLGANSMWGWKLYFMFVLFVQSKGLIPLTRLPLARVCRRWRSNTLMCWPTSNKSSSNSQGAGNCWVMAQKHLWQKCVSNRVNVR